MKKMTLLLFLFCLSASSIAQDYFAADGFISISEQSWKRINGITHFCDRPGVDGEQCFDEISPSMGSESGEYSPSIWRSADDYIKHMLTQDFKYIGMSARESGLFLYYKKN